MHSDSMNLFILLNMCDHRIASFIYDNRVRQSAPL